MSKTDLQLRIRAAGLSQVDLAAILGVAPVTMYRWVRGAQGLEWPRSAEAFLSAWEALDGDQRAALRAKLL